MNVSNNCGCTGKNGKQKTSYRSEDEAKDQANHAISDRNVVLSVYECPYGGGFHLTSNTHSY